MSKVVEIKSYKHVNKGSLIGFLTIEIPHFGLQIKDITYFKKGDQTWFNMPQREYEDNNGDRKFYKIVSFIEKDRYEAFMKELTKSFKEYINEEGIDLEESSQKREEQAPENDWNKPVETDDLPF